MSRPEGRKVDELRPVKVTRDYLPHAEGSVFFEIGDTKVICTASLEEKVPIFLRGTGKGWITAEYSMIPRATHTRTIRESTQGRIGGRTHEIQRVIGRSLRSIVDLKMMPDCTLWIDCDVVRADGGTRTAAITGSFIAMYDALKHMIDAGIIKEMPVQDFIAAISVGIVDGEPVLDLCFSEDSSAQVDMNLVMTDSGKIIEIQGTAEEHPFTRAELERMIKLASKGISELTAIQKQTVAQDLKKRAK